MVLTVDVFPLVSSELRGGALSGSVDLRNFRAEVPYEGISVLVFG